MDGFLWWCGWGLELSTYVPPGVSAGGLSTKKKTCGSWLSRLACPLHSECGRSGARVPDQRRSAAPTRPPARV